MKLLEVLAGTKSLKKIAGANLPPQLAIDLYRYLKLLQEELDVVEAKRIALIHKIANTKEGEFPVLHEGTPEHLRFLKEFTDILNVESNIKSFEMKFDVFLEQLKADPSNKVSPDDLLVVESFFKKEQIKE